MLYTIVSPAEIFMQPPADICEHQTPFGCVMCSRTEKGEIVERLVTTDPFEYLKPCYSPGALYSAGKKEKG